MILNNRPFIWIIPIFVAGIFLFPHILHSQSRSVKSEVKNGSDTQANPAPGAEINPKKTSQIKRLPDLVVRDIQLDKDCNIIVTIKNIGTAGAPNSGYDPATGASIQVYKGSQAWGGLRLGAFDPAGRLKKPGASVKQVWFPEAKNLDLEPGTHSIKVVVDGNNAVTEANERNNSRMERLLCRKPAIPKAVAPVQNPPALAPDTQPPLQAKKVIRNPELNSVSEKPAPRPGPRVPDQLNEPLLVDLAITDISIDPPNPRIAKDIIRITVTIQNIGIHSQFPGAPEAYFQMELTDDPYTQYYRKIVPEYSMTIPPLTAGEEFTISQTITIPRRVKIGNTMVTLQPGPYKLLGQINTTNYQPDEEQNSSNNEFTRRFDVRDPAPSDLVLDNITLTSDCRLKLTFHNEGAAIPDEDFAKAWVRVSKDNGQVNEQEYLSAIDPNGLVKHPGFSWMPMHYRVNYIWPINPNNNNCINTICLTPGQTSSFQVSVDPYHAISDAKPGNNAKTKTLTCP